MSELPAGFTIDEAPSELPEGFSVDAHPQEQIPTQQPDLSGVMSQYNARSLDPKRMAAIDELKRRGVIGGPETLGTMPDIKPAFGSVEEAAKAGTKSGIDLLRPSIEGMASVAAGMAGMGAGPAAPLAVPAGAALGYTASKKILDSLEGWATLPPEVKKAPAMAQVKSVMEDYATGLTFEFGGPVAMKLLSYVGKGVAGGYGKVKDIVRKNTPAISEEQVSKRAAEIIQEHRGNLAQYDKNLAEAQGVTKEIEGFSPSLVQKTGDPGLTKLERGIAGEITELKKAENYEAIESFLKGKFSGSQTVDDVLENLTAQKAGLQAESKQATQAAKISEEAIPSETPQVTGQRITETISGAKDPVRKIEKEYWDKVPNYEMAPTETDRVFKELAGEPSTAQNIIKKHYDLYKKRPKTIKGLQTAERELNDVLFDPNATATEKRVLGKIKTAINDDFKALGEAAEAGDFATVSGKVVHPKQLQKELTEIDEKLKRTGNASGEMQQIPDPERGGKVILNDKYLYMPGYNKESKYKLYDRTTHKQKVFPTKESMIRFATTGEDVKFLKPQPIGDKVPVVSLEVSGYKGQDMPWTETMKAPTILKKDMTAYHYSDTPLKNIGSKEMAFFTKDNPYNYTVNGYQTTIPKGSKVQFSSTGEEIRYKIPVGAKVETLKKGWSKYIKPKNQGQVTFLKGRKEIIEKQLAEAEPAKNAAIAYANAKAYSKSQMQDRFKSGVIKELEAQGTFQGGKKLSAEKRPLKLMNVESADKFINAVGKEDAANIMLRHYADDMAKKVKTDKAGRFVSSDLTRWFKKNSKVLERYGIDNEFKTADKAHKSMREAFEAQKLFDDSIAAKMLNSDPQKSIARAFEGGEGVSAKNTGAIMLNLLRKTKGDKNARRGLENAYKEFMFDQAKTTAKTLSGGTQLSKANLEKAISRFEPATKALYRTQPEKIKALKTVQKALLIMNRTAAGVGGGSDTSEKMGAMVKILSTLSHVPGARYTGGLFKIGLGKLKNLNEKETTNMIAKLLYDPDIAQIIEKASRKNPPVALIERELNNYMDRAAIQAGRTATQGEQ